MGKSYDRAYFDRWYRDSRRRVGTPAELARQTALAVAATEHVLARPLRTVLDVGCGEASWRATLRRVRPEATYLGVDPSPYVVARFGKSRRIVSGSFGTLGELNLPNAFDLVVCADVLHYVPDEELRRGLREVARLVGGLAYLEVQTSDDDFVGDRHGWIPRSARRYRTLFRRAGLVPCGLHLYLGPEAAGHASVLELLRAGGDRGRRLGSDRARASPLSGGTSWPTGPGVEGRWRRAGRLDGPRQRG